RHSLFSESVRPLANILCATEIVEGTRLELHCLLERHAHGSAHDILGEALSEGRALSEHLCIAHRFLEQFVCGINPVDETDPVCVLGVNALPGQNDLHGMAEADDLRESYQAPITGVKAPLDVLQREFRVGRTEAHVARKREFE